MKSKNEMPGGRKTSGRAARKAGKIHMKKIRMLGFDIGDYRLKITFREPGYDPEFISEKVPEGMVRDGKVVSWNALGDFIREVLQDYRIRCKDAAVAIPYDICYMRTLSMPKMTAAQLKINLPYEFHDYISDEMDQYVYDYSVLGQDEKELRLFAAAVRKETLDKYQAMFRRARLKLVMAAPEICALENLLRMRGIRKGVPAGTRDYAILDLGHRSLKMHFFKKGRYDVSRSMEPGCAEFAKRIAAEGGSDIHIAQIASEQNYNQSMEKEPVSDIYNQMAVQIMRVLNFYSYNNPDNNIETVFCCGGGAENENLISEIQNVAGVPVKPLADEFPETRGGDDEKAFSPQAYGITFRREDIEDGSEGSFE